MKTKSLMTVLFLAVTSLTAIAQAGLRYNCLALMDESGRHPELKFVIQSAYENNTRIAVNFPGTKPLQAESEFEGNNLVLKVKTTQRMSMSGGVGSIVRIIKVPKDFANQPDFRGTMQTLVYAGELASSPMLENYMQTVEGHGGIVKTLQ